MSNHFEINVTVNGTKYERQVEPRTLLYMIWATTQHYADFEAQIRALSGKRALSAASFDATTDEVVRMILRASGARSPDSRDRSA